MPVYSHSQLSTFEQCPLKFKYRYIDRIIKPEEKGIEAFTGTMVHDTLQKLYDDLNYEKLDSLDDLLAFYQDHWRKNWSSSVKIAREGFTEENYRDYGARCIRNYYDRYRPFNQSTTLATEMHLAFALDSEGRYKFQGYIDRLARRADGAYEIHDYKTGGTMPGQAAADRDRQLPLYQLGLQARWEDVERVDLIWHYVGLDSTLVSRRRPDEIEDLRQKTVELIDRIESAEDFPPVKSQLCKWCEYQPECPLWRHVVAVSAMPAERAAEDEGWQLASDYADLKLQADQLTRRIADLRDRILGFASDRNVRVLQGKNARVSVSEREQVMLPTQGERERGELESFVRQTGEWERLSELSASRLGDALSDQKRPEAWRERLRQLLRVNRTFTLRLKRADERDTDD